MAPRAGEHARLVRWTFLVAFLVLLVPSRLIALSHAPNLARFAGASLSTLLVWWGLYRLSVRAVHRAWFTAIAIPALYIATFGPPVLAWATWLILAIVNRIAVRYVVPSLRPRLNEDEPPASEIEADDAGAGGVAPTGAVDVEVVDLDAIGAPYRRILIALRILRASAASLASSTLLVLPAMVVFSSSDGGSFGFGVAAGAAMALFLGLLTVLVFAWLRALWRGSVRAARTTATLTIALAVVVAGAGLATIDRELVVTGGIWFHLLAYGLQLALLAGLASASVTIVRRRNDGTLTSLLRQNARCDWRASVQQLTGIGLPRHWSIRALPYRCLALGILAFSVEGAAFYVYFKAFNTLLDASERVKAGSLSFVSGPPSLLEGHYVSLVTIAAFVVPVFYVATQVTLALADRLRSAARRAGLRPAGEVLQEDVRPPVLFLRDFTDDQVALDRVALPGWVRTVDPGNTQATLEDVMEAYAGIGPVIAIGRPGDVTPPVGAARQYLPDGGWKEVVLSLMDRAAIIVVGGSDSPGLVWEIDHVRDRGHLDKCVFVLPPTRRHNHRLARQLLERLLPPIDGSARGAAGSALSGARSRRVVGLVVRRGTVSLLVSRRRPSQVEFDVTLRWSMPSGQAAPAVVTA